MDHPLLKQVLAARGHRIQRSFAWIGVVAGLSILLLSLHLYLEFLRMTSAGEDWIDSRYLVVQKRIDLKEATTEGRASFNEEEIDRFERFPSVTAVAPFRSNAVPAGAEIGGGIFPQIFSYLFLESVPDSFVDTTDPRWNWKSGTTSVPLLVPTEYLNLYNFGFAPSQGLPQIPPDVVPQIPFRLHLYPANDSPRSFEGRVIGFSDRINTILVPDSFLETLNRETTLPGTPPRPPARILLEIADTPDPDLLALLASGPYTANREALSGGRIRTIAHRLASGLLILGSGVVALAVLVVLLTLERHLDRSAATLRSLYLVGFPAPTLARIYELRTLRFLGFATLSALALQLLAGSRIRGIFSSGTEFGGIAVTRWEIPMIALGTFVLLALWTTFRIRQSVVAKYQ